MIVVTGGTKGIGKAIVEGFAKAGYAIATCSRNEPELKQLQKEIKEKYEVEVFVKQADFSKKEEVIQFAGFVKQTGKPLEVLVNNTGVFIPGQIHNEEEGALEQMMETNLYSTYHLTRALIGGMVQRKSGHIFNICSIASITAYPNGGSYAISKHAMLGFSHCLREEMKEHNVRVTAVLPGATLTASWEGVDLPEDRFSKPEDVAEMVLAAHKLSERSVVEDIVIRPQLGDL
ncbi:SDR family oxidoreductase [Rapidithrix thailandica]|uniref:SDR family oxidoreductase n=1 Tax=Rapidithrix thailandica TaxID=413964 RepID=A0AAW9RT86_9BACT